MNKTLKIAAGLALLSLIPTAAMAHTDVSIGLNLGGGYYRPAPVYVAPAPVYVAPAPVYVPPPVVYYRPAPPVVYYQPTVRYVYRDGYYRHY